MLQPKKTKFRRSQKGRIKGIAHRGNELAFGSFGIKSLGTIWLTGRQIEAARIAVTRYMQRQGQVWIRVFPDKPITKVGVIGVKVWICRGEKYGKVDLAPNFTQKQEGRGMDRRNDRRDGDRKGGFRRNKKQ